MYTKCIQNVCITKCIPHFNKLLHTFYISNLYQMYTKCLFTRRNPHFDKLLYTKYIQNFVYEMYLTFWQTFVYISYTKFSWHSSTDFVYKMCTKVCWNVVYILYTSVAYVLYNSCILNVNTVSCGNYHINLAA